jgi:hypothetical protein
VQRLVRDLYRMLDEINSEDVPVDLKVAESYDDFIWDTKNNDYDLKSFAMRLKATVSSDANVLRSTFFLAAPDLFVLYLHLLWISTIELASIH